MSAYANDPSMFVWLDKNKQALMDGKGFTGGKRKHRYAPIGKETAKERAWNEQKKQGVVTKRLPKNIHYGDEVDRSKDKVMTWDSKGYTITLWSDGNLSCNCNGWIFKRAKVQRECVHVREKYAELKKCSVPDKHTQKVEDRLEHKIDKLEQLIRRIAR